MVNHGAATFGGGGRGHAPHSFQAARRTCPRLARSARRDLIWFATHNSVCRPGHLMRPLHPGREWGPTGRGRHSWRAGRAVDRGRLPAWLGREHPGGGRRGEDWRGRLGRGAGLAGEGTGRGPSEVAGLRGGGVQGGGVRGERLKWGVRLDASVWQWMRPTHGTSQRGAREAGGWVALGEQRPVDGGLAEEAEESW
jgi:hypothetical protein